jgi:GT2 family glycosyltransferase
VSKANYPASTSGRITIIVPVYGDWPSLKSCVQAVIEHTNPAQFDVLLVNDNGPDADEIEAGLRGLIYGHPNMRYERNATNLGFVQTCNRAVYDLDHSGNNVLLLNSDTRLTAGALQEMQAVLDLSPHHGAVCPRSNDATIATIPFFRRQANEPRSAERSIDVYTNTVSRLPRYYISPVAVGFCLLIRRSLIDEFELFDEIFGRGYSEENDFCLRVNAFGYSSLIANHAFVYHEGSSSFGPAERARLDEAHSVIVRERYPHYPASVVTFIHHDYSAADRFADLLSPHSDDLVRTVLVDLRDLDEPTGHEASRIAADLTAIAIANANGNPTAVTTTITVATRFLTIGNLELSSVGLQTIDPDRIEQVFDVGVALSLITSCAQLATFNRHCLRWLIVARELEHLRSWATRAAHPAASVAARLTLKHADVVLWESPEICSETERFLAIDSSAGATAVLTASTASTADIARELHNLIARSSHETDSERLEKRNQEIGDIVKVDSAARHEQERTTVESIESSGAYQFSRKISKLVAPLRRLVRRH